MTNPPDKGFLVFVLVFGIVSTAASIDWLSKGAIVIRKGATQVGLGGHLPHAHPHPRHGERVAGTIDVNNVLFYPLCGTWVALGVSMITLAALSFFYPKEIFLKLSSYSLLGVLILGFGTVALAYWSGR